MVLDMRISSVASASTAPFQSFIYSRAATRVPSAELINLALPWWAAVLEPDEREEMAHELRAADSDSEFRELMEDWRATAEARANRGLMEQLARTDRIYIPWS
ncbi:MAG: hypothetical protein HY690_10525 [Chloroflexi bacterium]|nr:hypothetical protein [Chloroflexota bacterium]